MAFKSLEASVLAIPFKVAFKHASAERKLTETLWVKAQGHTGLYGYGEGCPREYVTQENLASTQAFVAAHRAEWLSNISDVHSLAAWVNSHHTEIDQNPAAWTSVELALLDLFCKEQEKSVEAMLGLITPTGRFTYTAVLGDADPQSMEAQLAHYQKAGFGDFKIKLSGNKERDLTKVSILNAAGISPQKVRADANNFWRDTNTALAHLQALDYPFWAIEEPLQPGDIAGMQRISSELNTKIILDESLLRSKQLKLFHEMPQRWIANLRVSKMGGLLRSLEFLQKTKQCGVAIIVGAHVGETSLLTRVALTIAANARDHLLAQEGAFGTHLLAYDAVQPSLMFGAAGVLDADALDLSTHAGWGLKINSQIHKST